MSYGAICPQCRKYLGDSQTRCQHCGYPLIPSSALEELFSSRKERLIRPETPCPTPMGRNNALGMGTTKMSAVVTVRWRGERQPMKSNTRIEQLADIAAHPVWDGNLISKTDRDVLVKDGYVQKVEGGWNIITAMGLTICLRLGIVVVEAGK